MSGFRRSALRISTHWGFASLAVKSSATELVPANSGACLSLYTLIALHMMHPSRNRCIWTNHSLDRLPFQHWGMEGTLLQKMSWALFKWLQQLSEFTLTLEKGSSDIVMNHISQTPWLDVTREHNPSSQLPARQWKSDGTGRQHSPPFLHRAGFNPQ